MGRPSYGTAIIFCCDGQREVSSRRSMRLRVLLSPWSYRALSAPSRATGCCYPPRETSARESCLFTKCWPPSNEFTGNSGSFNAGGNFSGEYLYDSCADSLDQGGPLIGRIAIREDGSYCIHRACVCSQP